MIVSFSFRQLKTFNYLNSGALFLISDIIEMSCSFANAFVFQSRIYPFKAHQKRDYIYIYIMDWAKNRRRIMKPRTAGNLDYFIQLYNGPDSRDFSLEKHKNGGIKLKPI